MSHIEPCLPVFWGHGVEDTEIPEHMGEECIRFLKQGLNFPDNKSVPVLDTTSSHVADKVHTI